MEKLKKLLKDNKEDAICLSGLFLLFICMLFIFVGHQGNFIIDCGREAYIPSQILKGKILYRDIFNSYGPLAFQWNALMYLLFGEKLGTLYLCGGISALIILISTYLISRTVASIKTSTAVQLVLISSCVFSTWIFNYIFPYSYSLLYALSSFLLSLLFAVYYLKYSNPKLAVLSSLFIGISIASKQEYTAFLAVLALIFSLIKPLSKKYTTWSILSFLSVPLLSWSVLFIQGLKISDCANALNLTRRIASSQSVKFFYSNLVGFFYNQDVVVNNLKILGQTFIHFAIASTILYFALRFLSKKSRFLKVISTVFLLVPLTLALMPGNATDMSFSWMPLSTVLIGLFFVGYLLTEHFKNNKTKMCHYFSLEDKIFLILIISAVISSIKSFFFLNLHVYGTFMFPLILLVNVVFIMEYIPRFFGFINKDVWKSAWALIFVVASIIFVMRSVYFARSINSYPVKTQKGTIYTEKQTGKTYQETLNYINSHMAKGSTLLVIPEGVMFNFMTDHPSNDLYYFLIPVNVESFGEDSIIKNLSKNKPDYIIINNRDTSDYGARYFGIDYGFKVNNFILKNYKLEQLFGDIFTVKIYKRQQ